MATKLIQLPTFMCKIKSMIFTIFFEYTCWVHSHLKGCVLAFPLFELAFPVLSCLSFLLHFDLSVKSSLPKGLLWSSCLNNNSHCHSRVITPSSFLLHSMWCLSSHKIMYLSFYLFFQNIFLHRKINPMKVRI